jgi:hypothetical protein
MTWLEDGPAVAGATALARRRYDRQAPFYDLLDAPSSIGASSRS